LKAFSWTIASVSSIPDYLDDIILTIDAMCNFNPLNVISINASQDNEFGIVPMAVVCQDDRVR
jgi:hypothetical protein